MGRSLVAIAATVVVGVLLAACSAPDAAGPARPVLRGVEQPAPGMLLVASRDLLDPNFFQTVVLLIHYDADGALGVVLNRRTETTVSEALPQIERVGEPDDAIYLGGPVAPDRVVVLARTARRLEDLHAVFQDVSFTFSVDTLRKLAGKRRRTADLRLFAGHAGWGPGQLDRELARGDWHLAPADVGTVFTPRSWLVWQRLIAGEDPAPELQVRATPSRPGRYSPVSPGGLVAGVAPAG